MWTIQAAIDARNLALHCPQVLVRVRLSRGGGRNEINVYTATMRTRSPPG